MTNLPEDGVKRIGDTRRQAESDLQASLRLIEGEDITPFLGAFTSFATALFDAEADEFVGSCHDSDELDKILRMEVTSRIIESILPERSLQIALKLRPDDADQRPIVQEVDSQGIYEEELSGELTSAREHIQGIHARHGYWERFMPPHIGFFIRSRDNARVREELGQVLQRRAFYWTGQFNLRVQPMRCGVPAAKAAENAGRMPASSWESLRSGFTQLRADCAIAPPLKPAGRLTAIWTAQPEPARWRLDYWNKKDGNGAAQRFKWLAQSAAAHLGFAGGGDDAVSFWLDQIKLDVPESHIRQLLIEGDEANRRYSVEILDICGLSADYCWKCEADEIRSRTTSGRKAMDPFQNDGSARPLGDNPFPEDYPAHAAFEEATWKAKEKIAPFKLECLLSNFDTKAGLIQAFLTFRKRWFSAAAFEATLIVGNEETAEWYEHWIEDYAAWLLEDTLSQAKRKDPAADPAAPDFFSPADIESIEQDLKLKLLELVTHYKGVAAARVVEVIGRRNAAQVAATPEAADAASEDQTGGIEPARVQTPLGCNINRLRKECGWSFDELANQTKIEKKLILGHVNNGKGAHPRNLRNYADAFTRQLGRPVSVAELES